jgi:outer membrane protein TolC
MLHRHNKWLAFGYTACVLLVMNCVAGTAWPQQGTRTYSASRLTLQDALDCTLEQHPNAEIQRLQVKIAQGARMQAAGPFDTYIGSSLGYSTTNDPLTQSEQQQAQQAGISTSKIAGNSSIYSFSQNKLLRNGISFSSGLDTSRDADNLLNLLGLNSSRVGLGITVPLLRGRGRNAVTARERSAMLEVTASTLDLNQIISQLAANTASSYWSLVAARKALEIAQASEQRGQTYVDNVQALIDADKVPRSDIYEVKANLADRSAARLQAQQTVVAAQQQLASDMGIQPSEMSDALTAIDDFPDAAPIAAIANDPEAIQEYAAQSLNNRSDYLASRERIAEANAQLTAAKNDARPQLDLNFKTGYMGIAEGRSANQLFSSPFSSIKGMDSSAGITYSFNVQNQVALGEAKQAEATLRQAQLRSSEIVRSMNFALKVAIDGVLNARQRVARTSDSVRSFEAALSGEQEKYRLGNGSVVNILTVEDRLTNALANQLQAQLAFALALTQLRLASGTLAPGNEPVRSVNADLFRTMPFTQNSTSGR